MLVTSTPGAGHVTPLMPVAVALRAAGHTVHWAIATDGGDAVAAMGFEWSPAGVAVSTRRKLAEADLPRIMELPPAQRRGPLFAALFARAAAPVMREDLTPLFDSFRPELVVRETGELAAVPMTLARDVPLVTVAFSGVIPSGPAPRGWTRWSPCGTPKASVRRPGMSCTAGCTSTRSRPRSINVPRPTWSGTSGRRQWCRPATHRHGWPCSAPNETAST